MTMSERVRIITDILQFAPNFRNTLAEKVPQLKWDSDEVLYTITIEDLRRAIILFDQRKISEKDIENWANFIENREDVTFECEDIEEVIVSLR
jgi:hypothetical protein